MNTTKIKTKHLVAVFLVLQFFAANPFGQQVRVLAQAGMPADDRRYGQYVDDARAEKLPVDLRSILDRNGDSDRLQNVIVQTAEPPTRFHRQVIRQHGGRVRHIFESINALLVEIPVSRIEELAAEQGIDFITPDRTLSRTMDAETRLLGADKLRQPMASSYGGSYPAVDGTGVGIAIIDSGVSSLNQDLYNQSLSASRIVAFKDFVNPQSSNPISFDDYGHGTSVAGVAAGDGWGSLQRDSAGVEWYPGNYGDFTGVAPNASIISVKVLDSDGISPVSRVIQAIDYCISKKDTYKIKVINLSIGSPVLQSYKTDPLCQAVEQAVAAGIVVVCAAGNCGHNDVITGYDSFGKAIYQTVYGGILSPANDPYVITVGATKDPQQSLLTWTYNGPAGQPYNPYYSTPPILTPNPNPLRRTDVQVAAFSSRGPTLVDGIVKPDIVAPGTKVITTVSKIAAITLNSILPQSVVPLTSSHFAMPLTYVQYSGTSFAAPMVSGTVALMLQANPKLTPRTVKAILMVTAQQLPYLAAMDQIEKLLTQGAGFLNAFAAVRIAQNIRTDVNKAKAGQNLLKSNRSLTGLDADLKLILNDANGHFLEYAVLDSSILLANGHLLSDGFLLTDSILLANGHMLTNSILLANGHMLSNGSVWPDGHLLSNNYATTYCLQSLGAQLVALQQPIQNWIQTPNEIFYVDGIVSSTGYVDGGMIFSAPARNIWGSRVADPTAAPLSAGAESVNVMASNDDTSITGVRFITSSSPYYPRQR